MALTPTTLIATTGLMNGGGFQINTDQASKVADIVSNPLVSGIGNLSSYTSTVPGLSDTLNSLPTFMTSSASTASSITSQSENMLPGAGTAMGNKNFLQSFSGAATFGSATAEYAAALKDFGSKSFGDLGVGVSNFTGMLTSGVGSLLPTLAGGPQALAAQASSLVQSAAGSIPGGLTLPSLPTAVPVPGVPDRKSTRLNSSHIPLSRMPSSA